MTTAITSPARITRQLRDGTGTRPTWRAVRVHAAMPRTISVITVAHDAPLYPNSGIKVRFRARLATRLHPAAHVNDDWRSDAFRAPMKALLTNATEVARASTRSAGSESRNLWPRRSGVSGWASTTMPRLVGQPMRRSAL